MNNFLVIFVCMIAGILCHHLKKFPANSAQVLNSFIIYLSLPALVLSQMPKVLASMDYHGLWWLPVSMAWMTFGFSFFFFTFIGKKLKWSRPKIGALILTAGLGNTSFVGFPILEALIGPHAIATGILVDQPGSFLVLSTVGILVASLCSGSEINSKIILKRVFTFPPFIALLISIFWAMSGLHGVEQLSPAIGKIAATLVPLALFSVGFQLRFDLAVLKKRSQALSLGLIFKLFIIPAFFALFYLKFLNVHDLASRVTVLESAMASMITSAVVATEFNLDSELANLMVGIGIPLSFVTVYFWDYFLFQ